MGPWRISGGCFRLAHDVFIGLRPVASRLANEWTMTSREGNESGAVWGCCQFAARGVESDHCKQKLHRNNAAPFICML
jgi:hypothetical protein